MIRNFTPHPVTLVLGDNTITFESEGVARCAQTTEKVDEVMGIPVTANSFGEVTGLPEPDGVTLLIVSGLVEAAARAAGRTDCVFPAQPVRDSEGRIVGCRSLGRSR